MEEDTLYSDISLVNGKKFRFSTFENAPIFGRSSKDGYVTLGFTDESDVPQVIKKRHRTNAYLAREVRILECIKKYLIDDGVCFNFPTILYADDKENNQSNIFTTWEGFSMGFFRYYFKYNIFDIASLIVQYAYAVSVLIEFLNIEHKDPYKENIVVRPVPSSGRYKITYTFSLENEIVFSFNLYTKYIFTIIDFVNVELVSVNNKSPNEIIDIFNGTKRSTSRSSNFDRSSALNIYKYILGLWDSLESYFSLKDMAKNGLDIRNLNFLSKGIDEFQKIVTELSKTLGDQFIKVTHTSNLKKKTNISSPSFSNFKCTMNIEFLPDNNGGMSMDSTDVMDDAANVDISLNEVKRKKRGRPRLYKDNAEKQRMYRVKKQRKKYETSYDFLFLEPDVRDHIKKVNNYFFNIPQLYANTITIDSILVEVVCNKNRLCVRAKEDISKGTIITQFTGWMVNFTPRGDDRDHDIVKINEKKYEGIRYPRMLCGVGSLIRKAEKKEVPNITFVQHENRIIWAKSSIKIFKGEELIRPNK